jgi:hypothetical protein
VFCRGDARPGKHKASVTIRTSKIFNCGKAIYLDNGSHAVVANSNSFTAITSRPACHVTGGAHEYVFFE